VHRAEPSVFVVDALKRRLLLVLESSCSRARLFAHMICQLKWLSPWRMAERHTFPMRLASGCAPCTVAAADSTGCIIE